MVEIVEQSSKYQTRQQNGVLKYQSTEAHKELLISRNRKKHTVLDAQQFLPKRHPTPWFNNVIELAHKGTRNMVLVSPELEHSTQQVTIVKKEQGFPNFRPQSPL